MNNLPLLFFVLLIGCAQVAESDKSAPLCEFELHKMDQCIYQDYVVNIQTITTSDEAELQTLIVDIKGKRYTLSITSDTILLEGDRGFLSFEDINFDGIPDIAVTTSFGLPNLYMDYWVFDKATKKFAKIGNYTQFTVNAESKTLTNQIKDNATTYQQHEYFFKDINLIEK
jgi:hypothetical protein